MTRRICIITGTRAEYGLLRRLAHAIRNAPDCTLQIIATGSHLSPEFGSTYREIEQDGHEIDSRVEILLNSDSAVGIGKAMGLGMIGLVEALERLRPDLIVLLGDRYEMLSAATAALVSNIPIAHIHGGEITEGAFDDSIRHAITKMAHLHFVAAEPYRQRVIQLGEAPDRVFLVGGLGIDAIKHLDLLDRTALEQSLNFRLGAHNLLVTFHPPTLEDDGPAQMAALLEALDELGPDVHLIFTLPNADVGNQALRTLIDSFVLAHPNSQAFSSLGQLRYLSCMRHVDGVVGNSSSGLLEAPALRTGTIDIGDRQAGRLRARSVIHCAPQVGAIRRALRELLSNEFQAGLVNIENPYGNGGACEMILTELRRHPLEGLIKKSFHDMKPADSALG